MFETKVIPEQDLIPVYAPPNLLSVMPGNKVMLRSGSPCMTVSIAEEGRAYCQWEEDGKLSGDWFDLRCLTCYGAQ